MDASIDVACACTSSLRDSSVWLCMQAYARKQAKCLLDIEGNTDSGNPALARLQLWSLELHALCVSFSIGSPKAHGILYLVNMQDGSLYQEPPPDSVHADLLVSQACHML